MDLAIVILNYNTRDLLRDCLHSLAACTGLAFETLVVDNSSTDGSAAMMRAEFPHICLFESPNNGYAAGNNVALRQVLSRADAPRAIMLLNADTLMPPDGPARLVAFLDEHPDAAVVGPKLVRKDGALDLACRRSFPTPEVSFYRLIGLSKLLPRSRRFARYNLTYLDENATTEVDAVVGACMVLRTEALRQAGIFDESFFMYGEDLDLALRIKQKGWKVYYDPAVQVLHYKRESSKKSARAQREFWRAMDIFYRKHYQKITPRWQHWLVVTALAGVNGAARLRERWS